MIRTPLKEHNNNKLTIDIYHRHVCKVIMKFVMSTNKYHYKEVNIHKHSGEYIRAEQSDKNLSFMQ